MATGLLSQLQHLISEPKLLKLGCWCSWADDHGDVLTYWVLTNDTQQLIPVSDIHPAHIRLNQHIQTDNSSSLLLGEQEIQVPEELGLDKTPTRNSTII